MVQLMISGGNTKEAIANEIFNFLDKVIVQAMNDRIEWFRAKALFAGKIDWTFNDINWVVDYGIPAANFLANRTGTDAWDSTTSKFWEDIATLMSLMNYDVAAFVMHVETFNKVIANAANNIVVTSREPFEQGGSLATVHRHVGSIERLSSDFRERASFILYSDESEIFDLSNPGKTTKLKFVPTGKILAVGNPSRRGYVVGEGSIVSPIRGLEVGYTHVAPTVEGGRPGLWAQAYTPEALPMQLHGRGAGNVIPVIRNADLIAVASSDLS
jgi:hypothetical protein